MPNEATLVFHICHHLFPWNIQIPAESHIFLLYEFPGSFMGHNTEELRKWGDGEIKYPLVKCDPSQRKSKFLQTPAQDDLRSRVDFVFVASFMILDATTRVRIVGMTANTFRFPCLSHDQHSCAVAIIAEAKANSSQASRSAAKVQWSLAAYLQIMNRISIAREATYADDENICQYGYLICGLDISVWKMSLRLNTVKRRQSDGLNKYFSIPYSQPGCIQHKKFQRFSRVCRAP